MDTPQTPENTGVPTPEPPPVPVQPPTPVPAAETPQPPQPAETDASAVGQSIPADWPTKGYTGPQPWQDGVLEVPAITHTNGFITSGEAGPEVIKLAALLEQLGYPTSISQGQNPHAIYSESERAAVAQFRTEYGVQEDPQIVAATIPSVVGPWTWEALYRAARAAEGAGRP